MLNNITINNPKFVLNFYDNQSTFRMADFFQHLTIIDHTFNIYSQHKGLLYLVIAFLTQ